MANQVAITAVLLVVVCANEALGQAFNQHLLPQPSFAIQPPPLQLHAQNTQFAINNNEVQDSSRRSFAHRAVIINAEHEAQLPAQLLNPFYKNPRISEALAKQSWFTPEETIVQDREAEKIPRQKIYYVLKSAGLVNRRRR